MEKNKNRLPEYKINFCKICKKKYFSRIKKRQGRLVELILEK